MNFPSRDLRIKMAHKEKIVLQKIKTEDEKECTRSAGFICPKCQSHFLLSNLFEDHIREHHIYSKTVLEHPDKDLKTFDELIKKEYPVKEQSSECQHKSGSFSPAVSIHMEIKIEDKCSEQSFIPKSDVEDHYGKSTAEKPSLIAHDWIIGQKSNKSIQAKSCSKSFLTKQRLKSHKEMHTDEKLFRCQICTRSFALKSTLTNHGHISKPVTPESKK